MEKFDAFKNNFKKVVIGAGIVTASVIPDKASAGIFDKNKDKIDLNKVEQTSNKENNNQEKSNFKELIIGGVKYPFDKEYISDKDFYRVVSYGESIDQMTSIKIAMFNAKTEILKQKEENESNINKLKIISQKTFLKDGKYITIIAVEVPTENVVSPSK